MMTCNEIEYVQGSVLDVGADVIIQQVNCMGVMGSGLAKTIVERYPEVLLLYKNRAKAIRRGQSKMGDAQIIECNDGTYVCNLFSQYSYGYDGRLYTKYEAMYSALEKVGKYFHGKKIAVPFRLGCDLGGGDWEIVSLMIEKLLGETDNRIVVCMYDEK